MATTADICNLALSMLGDHSSVTSIRPPDGSPQAGNCARWFPVALRQLIEAHDWSFLTRRKVLTPLSTIDADLYSWRAAFGMPSDCVRVIKVEAKTPRGLVTVPFEVENNERNDSRLLLCNAEKPVLSYVTYSEKADLFPSYFLSCLVPLLAALLVGPIKRTDVASTMAQNLLQQYAQALSQAKTIDAKNSVHKRRAPLRIPPQLRAREA